MAWDDTKTDAVDVLHAADYNEIVSQVKSRATKTDSDLTLYVYEDATGTGDGSSKANGFTTLQAAIDAIPDVAQNVTIIVCKGSTNYLGQTTTIQKASVKSLTIQGEFYAYEACDANAVAGKVVDADADFSDFEVGDRVVCTKYSGTVGSSAIVDYFYATITEVGEGYVQTSEATKIPTTGWRYLINQTVFDLTGESDKTILTNYNNLNLIGIDFCKSTGTSGRAVSNIKIASISMCIFDSNYNSIITSGGETYVYYSAIVNAGNNASLTVTSNFGRLYNSGCIFVGGTFISSVGFSQGNTSGSIFSKYCGFFRLLRAISIEHASSNNTANSCYIASTCTYGAYGYNITLTNCTNNAATPMYNRTSGGRVADVDIHAATEELAIADNDEILIYDASASANRRMTRSNFLSGVLRINDIIGVKWNSASNSPTLTRVDEDLQEITSPYLGGWTKFFDSHAIWGQMWRCQLSAAGVPTFGTNARGDGLTLTNDYIMTRVPRVYDKFVYDDGDWYWLVSPEPSSGFNLQPTFNQRGHSASPAEQIYVGAYNAHDAGSSKLGSKSGTTPLANQTMATFETRGNNIGAGWGLMNFHTLCLLQMLFYIEYASFDSQTKVGPGYTNAANTGPLASGGAAAFERTNGTSVGTNDTQAVSWRGIENLWGNIWQWIPGYNTADTSHRILKRDGTGTIADVMASGSYEEIVDPIPLNGTTRVSGTDGGTYCHGYVSAFDRDSSNILGPMFIPGALLGASDQYLTDYFYSHQSGISQMGVLRAGGYWGNGLRAGVGFRGSSDGPSYVHAGIGGRVEAIF